MKPFVVILPILISMGCSNEQEYNACAPPGDSIYVSAVENELVAQGVEEYKKTERDQICTTSGHWLEMNRARGRAEQYYKGAAMIIYNADQKNRVMQYLESHSRKFKISAMEGGKEFIVVHSGSQKELEETKKVLNEFAEIVSCSNKKSSNNALQSDNPDATRLGCR